MRYQEEELLHGGPVDSLSAEEDCRIQEEADRYEEWRVSPAGQLHFAEYRLEKAQKAHTLAQEEARKPTFNSWTKSERRDRLQRAGQDLRDAEETVRRCREAVEAQSKVTVNPQAVRRNTVLRKKS